MTVSLSGLTCFHEPYSEDNQKLDDLPLYVIGRLLGYHAVSGDASAGYVSLSCTPPDLKFNYWIRLIQWTARTTGAQGASYGSLRLYSDEGHGLNNLEANIACPFATADPLGDVFVSHAESTDPIKRAIIKRKAGGTNSAIGFYWPTNVNGAAYRFMWMGLVLVEKRNLPIYLQAPTAVKT